MLFQILILLLDFPHAPTLGLRLLTFLLRVVDQFVLHAEPPYIILAVYLQLPVFYSELHVNSLGPVLAHHGGDAKLVSSP